MDVRIGIVETHQRAETEALTAGLPVIPLRTLFDKGRELREMDVEGIIAARPEVVLVDELAHTNIKGSTHEKRWKDVLDILNAGINVISAVNVQHIESLQEEVRAITGITVSETIPDSIIHAADEVVTIDLTAEELIERLKSGKIYKKEKIETALRNFFQPGHILQLRELVLKQVATHIERKVESKIPKELAFKHERLLACISSNNETARKVIRKTARLAGYYNCKWMALYVQTPKEHQDKIQLDKQRHLIHNFKLATELGAEVIRINNADVPGTIKQTAMHYGITTICIGKPHIGLWRIIRSTAVFNNLLQKLSVTNMGMIILS